MRKATNIAKIDISSDLLKMLISFRILCCTIYLSLSLLCLLYEVRESFLLMEDELRVNLEGE